MRPSFCQVNNHGTFTAVAGQFIVVCLPGTDGSTGANSKIFLSQLDRAFSRTSSAIRFSISGSLVQYSLEA
jgi:hypothetical protein